LWGRGVKAPIAGADIIVFFSKMMKKEPKSCLVVINQRQRERPKGSFFKKGERSSRTEKKKVVGAKVPGAPAFANLCV